jgi:uncharacterized protein
MLCVSLVCAARAGEIREWLMEVPEACTVQQALDASPLSQEFPLAMTMLTSGELVVSIWGRHVDLASGLRDRDRIELLRRLLVDPKVARRERFQKQGERTAGLFAQRRPGGKAGY